MAIVTLTVTDNDLNTGQFLVDFNVEGSMADDGFVTAAHVTGLFIMDLIKTTKFGESVATFSHTYGYTVLRDSVISATLTLTDTDLDAGQFEAVLQHNGGDLPEKSATPALIVANFLRRILNAPSFQEHCHEFATLLILGREGAQVNAPTDFSSEKKVVNG